ncbi:hypothetical protein HH308_16430 [Gordonia sp. TBRC 11910]|uniref:Uncharacterized protein n=1 Tax=Gordonia asplenii TaxID=2725283 RepID=A0A848KW38_9ACTN|nr:DUF6400 family protein [Gordonia asplenii]NMO02800.1 hypothetical protein [Gordonia asplenii]
MGNDCALSVAFDLTFDEARRRNAVLAAMGDAWDPVSALAEEARAHDMLYSNLDSEQQSTYEELVEAGVLPSRGVADVAH